MTAGVKWHGLTELKRDLRTLAADMATEADPIVERAASEAAAEMAGAYPRSERTDHPHLADSLVVTARRRSATRVDYRLTNTAPHAHWFEGGTRGRPPGRVFAPIHSAFRRMMYGTLKGMLPKFNMRARGEMLE